MFKKSVNNENFSLTSEDSKLLYRGKRDKYQYTDDDSGEERIGKRLFRGICLCCFCIITLLVFFVALTSTFFILTWTGVLGNYCELELTYSDGNSTNVYNQFQLEGSKFPFSNSISLIF